MQTFHNMLLRHFTFMSVSTLVFWFLHGNLSYDITNQNGDWN